MKKIKQKWLNKSRLINWGLCLLGIVVIFIFICAIYFVLHYLIKKEIDMCPSIFLIIIITALFFVLGYVLLKFLFEISFDKKHEDTVQILKATNKSNIIIFLVYILILIIITIEGISTKNVKSALIVICVLYLIVSFIIWFFQFKFYYSNAFRNAVENKDLRAGQMSVLKTKIIRSILVAISGWILILFNVVRISKNIYITYIYAVVTTIVTLSNPSFFLFEYTYSLIDKFEMEQKVRDERNERAKAEKIREKKEKEREKQIENESNGSKNYTA